MSKNNIKEQKLGSSYFYSEDSDIYIIKKRFLAYSLKNMDFNILAFSTLILNAVIIYDLHSELIASLFIWAR